MVFYFVCLAVETIQCVVQSPLVIIPNSAPGSTGSPPYDFDGTCEHILSTPCDSDAYAVVGDFLQTDLSMGRVGLLVPGYYAIINEDLSLTEEGIQPDDVTTQMTGNETTITLFNGSVFVVSIIHTDDQIVILTAVGPDELCGLCGTMNGSLVSSDGMKVTDFMDKMQIDLFASSWLVEPSEQILRDDRRECGKFFALD